MRVPTRYVLAALLLVLGTVVAVYVVGLPGDDRTTVTFVDENGTELASADVVVSDSYRERYTGLSDTDSLGPNEGMLFVHPAAGEKTYVMRDMAFPIDMVFVAEDGTITTIHHAELPEEGEALKEYSGQAKYVVELPYEYTARHGIDVGDTMQISDRSRNDS